jgi:glycosyltransferase involved in cell wall biosynthesis
MVTLPAVKRGSPDERKPVSIIICARNEAENLKKNLPGILSQDYTNDNGKILFEVVVVNDRSEDCTIDVLDVLRRDYPHLRIVHISPNEQDKGPGKKKALAAGLQSAANDWILLTDADCSPAGRDWLQLMTAPLAAGKEIVAGYGGYDKERGILNSFARWETLHTFVQYSTYTMAGMPYMAVGRNLACTRGVLEVAMQHPIWNALPSGDDDLLVRISGTSSNTVVVCDQAAFTYSPAKASWAEWIHQKQRHLSTGKYYKPEVQALLGAYGLSHAGMWLAFVVLLCLGYYKIVLPLILIRSLLHWLVWWAAAKKLNEVDLVYLFPFFDLAWMIYNFAFLPYITWKNKYNWK